MKLDWKADLQDPVRRDFVNRQQFGQLMSSRGIGNGDTVVLYGGRNNWFAAYAYRGGPAEDCRRRVVDAICLPLSRIPGAGGRSPAREQFTEFPKVIR